MEALLDVKEQTENLESAFNDAYRLARNKHLEAASRLEYDKQEQNHILKAISEEISKAKEVLAAAFNKAQDVIKTFDKDRYIEGELDPGIQLFPTISGSGSLNTPPSTKSKIEETDPPVKEESSKGASNMFRIIPRENMFFRDICKLSSWC